MKQMHIKDYAIKNRQQMYQHHSNHDPKIFIKKYIEVYLFMQS